MSLGDHKDRNRWEATRRKFLKTLALIGGVSSFDFLGLFKKIGFAKEGDMTLEEMREKAMKFFPTTYH